MDLRRATVCSSGRPGPGSVLSTGERSGPAQRDERAGGAVEPSPRERESPGARSVGPPPPDRVGQYQISERIGVGGMGCVYRALHTRLKKWVALKILTAERVLDPKAVARFEREMEAIGRLDHANIVRATDAGEADGLHFLVMDLVDGIDLSRLVRLCGPLPVPEACELARQAADGLQYIHENGLVHRDIKPSNLLLSARGEVKILDLGLALLRDGDLPRHELTGQGEVMGTFDYMAPEQWEASHEVDIRADLYSLGCTLYMLLAGEPPFSGPNYNSPVRKMKAHALAPVPSVRGARPAVPAGLAALVERLLSKDPAARYAAPREVAQALQPFCTGADLGALFSAAHARTPSGAPADQFEISTQDEERAQTSPPGGPGATPSRRRRRLLRMVTAAAAVAAVGIVLVGSWWSKRPPGRPEPGNTGAVADAGAAATPAASERQRRFARRAWHNLLEEPPGEFFWWNPAGESHWDFKPDAQMLWVNSFHTALLSLGKTDSSAYKLQVGFRQSLWVGGVGVFFGGEKDSGPRSPSFRYQVIELRKYREGVDGAFALIRSLGSVQLRPANEPLTENVAMTSTILRKPPANQEQLLEIVVSSRDGLTTVRWNGETCTELTNDAIRARTQDAPYRGAFGVYCKHSSAVVSSARFMPMD